MTRHRCHIPDASGASVRVADEQAHHLARVLRVVAGDELIVFDGRGHEWLARVASVDRRQVVVDLIEPRVPVREPPVAVTLAVGLLKGDQMSTVVRDATALGVAAVVPFVSQHVALPAAAWRTSAVERWTRVAVSSATQCGRAVVPAVHEVARFQDLLAAGGYDERRMCVEPAHQQPAGRSAEAADGPRPATALLLVGPEGGWSDDELADARAAGVRWLDLGPRTLRAEIAPTVALSILWTRWDPA